MKHLLTISALFLIGFCASNAYLHYKEFTHKYHVSAKDLKVLSNERDAIKNWFTNQLAATKNRGPKFDITCGLCEIGIVLAISIIQLGGTEEAVTEGLVDLCTGLDILPPDVCDGAIRQYIPPLYYIIKNRESGQLTYQDICSVLIQDDPECVAGGGAWMTDWQVNIDGNKPFLFSPPYLPADIPLTKVLWLTDLHLDLKYAPGSWGDCDKPTCCRHEDALPDGGRPAGAWGDYACDTPGSAMNDLFSTAQSTHEYEMILFTGDIPHHVIWDYSKQDNINHFQALASMLYDKFPSTPVYPVVGNHEAAPCNLFAPESIWDVNGGNFSTHWVYENLADNFGRDLTEEARITFRRGGYYTLSPSGGLRIIAMNTQSCYNFNFWLLHAPHDLFGQLQWLSDTLLQAEQAKEKVWIIGHVPPGVNDCWWYWSKQYSRIINRFEGIIQGQFFGHKHEDYFKLFFDSSANPPRPTSSLMIGASGTAYKEGNPAFKVVYADGARGGDSTWELVDHETFITNLTEANLGSGTPRWFKLYNARDAYSLRSLRPNDLLDLVNRMNGNDQLFRTYYKHYIKDSDSVEIDSCETDECINEQLCQLLTSDISDFSHCDRVLGPVRSHTPPKERRGLKKILNPTLPIIPKIKI